MEKLKSILSVGHTRPVKDPSDHVLWLRRSPQYLHNDFEPKMLHATILTREFVNTRTILIDRISNSATISCRCLMCARAAGAGHSRQFSFRLIPVCFPLGAITTIAAASTHLDGQRFVLQPLYQFLMVFIRTEISRHREKYTQSERAHTQRQAYVERANTRSRNGCASRSAMDDE